MTTKVVQITTTEWTKLTDPGESGTVWKKAGKGGIVVDHTISTAATISTTSGALTIAKSKRVPLDVDQLPPLAIAADGVTDTFYGIALNDNSVGDEMTLALDVS